MKDAHLTAEDFRIILLEEDKQGDGRRFLCHLALCPVCYTVAGYLLGSGNTKRVDDEREELGT